MNISYFIIPLATLAVALGGSLFTSAGIKSGWYEAIGKPTWTPPGYVIGAAWTIIFILAAIAAIIAWNHAPAGRRGWIAGLFIANGILNVLWCYLFFTAHAIGAALWEMIILEITVDILIALIWPVSIVAALLLVPYGAWVLFATFLTYFVRMLNP